MTRLRLHVTGLACLALMAGIPWKDASAAEPKSRTFDFGYATVVRNIPAGAKQVAVWIPYPVSDDHQQIDHVEIVSPHPTTVATEREYGNRVLFLKVVRPAEREIAVELKFRVTRREHRVSLGDRDNRFVAEAGSESLRRWLQPDRLVPIDGKVRELAAEVTRGSVTDPEKARAIYNHAVATLKYDKSGTGWGRGDVLYACDAKRGNCTDFHAVFVGFCRSQGIPARFQIGFSVPSDKPAGEIAGYHCWAEFYSPRYGWIPVDASEAARKPELRDYFFGAHDEHRVQFSQGRDIRLNPSQEEGPLNYFVYPYVEIDGREHGDVEKKFSFRETKPAGGK